MILIIYIILFFKKKKRNKTVEEYDIEDEPQNEYDTDDELDYIPEDEEYNESENIEEGDEEMSLDEYEELQKKNKKTTNSKFDFIKFAVFCGALVLFLNFVVTICVIPTGSMEPTINAGDIVLINDLAYLTSEPQRGDIVVFKSDELSMKMNKRIIGIPGDSVSFKNGYVYVNEEMIDESEYLSEDVESNCVNSFVVPADSYFMLGDNRENSDDARSWENPYIPANKIKGKVFFHLPISNITSMLAK